MTILVTGGTGLIGSHIVRQLIEQGRDVVAFDRLPPPPKVNALADVADRLKLELGNVTDLANMLEAARVLGLGRVIIFS